MEEVGIKVEDDELRLERREFEESDESKGLEECYRERPGKENVRTKREWIGKVARGLALEEGGKRLYVRRGDGRGDGR